MPKTALLIITLLGNPGEPAIVKHREVLDMATCRPLARMLTEPRRVHARCVLSAFGLRQRREEGGRGLASAQ